jgi:hypothetical protein
MALQVKALLAGIPQEAIGYVEEALGSVYGQSNYTIVTPSNDSEANLAAADAVNDTRMALVVFSTDMDAYIQGKSGEGICSTGKYFKYANDDAALVSWLNKTFGSEVMVKPRRMGTFGGAFGGNMSTPQAAGAGAGAGAGYYPTEDLGFGAGLGAGTGAGTGYGLGTGMSAGMGEGAYSMPSVGVSQSSGYSSAVNAGVSQSSGYSSAESVGASQPSGYSSTPLYGDANVENIELKSQIKGLTEALNNIKRQYSLQQRVLNDTQSSVDSLKAELSEKDREVASLKSQLQAELSEKDREVASLKSQLQASEQAANSGRAEHDSLMRQVADLTRQLAAANQEKQGIRSSLLASQDYAKKLEATNIQLQSDNATSKTSLQESQASLGRVKSERDDALTALSEANKREKNLLAEKKKLEDRVAQSDKSLTILNQNRVNDANDTAVIEKTSWAYLASKSFAQDPVLLPRYYGDVAQHVTVVASGCEGDNQYVPQYIKSKMKLGYAGRLTEDDATSLGAFQDNRETLLVELCTDTYMDYYMHNLGVRLQPQGITWLNKGGAVVPYCQNGSQGLKVLSLGLDYINEAWLMNIPWPDRVKELERTGLNVVISVGCLSSHIRKLLFKLLGMSAGGTIIVSRGMSLSMRSTLLNMEGLFRRDKPESWMQTNWHIINPDEKDFNSKYRPLLKDSVRVFAESQEDKSNRNSLYIAKELGRGENHGA